MENKFKQFYKSNYIFEYKCVKEILKMEDTDSLFYEDVLKYILNIFNKICNIDIHTTNKNNELDNCLIQTSIDESNIKQFDKLIDYLNNELAFNFNFLLVIESFSHNNKIYFGIIYKDLDYYDEEDEDIRDNFRNKISKKINTYDNFIKFRENSYY